MNQEQHIWLNLFQAVDTKTAGDVLLGSPGACLGLVELNNSHRSTTVSSLSITCRKKKIRCK